MLEKKLRFGIVIAFDRVEPLKMSDIARLSLGKIISSFLGELLVKIGNSSLPTMSLMSVHNTFIIRQLSTASWTLECIGTYIV